MIGQETLAAMVAALEGRAAFYDLLASLYYRPLTEEQIERIAQGGFAPCAEVNALFDEGLHDIERSLGKRNTGTRQELAVDFTGAFAGTSSWEGHCAMPCESVFTSEEGLMYQGSYHEVHRVFKEHQVSRSTGFDFPDDHLSFLCTFMAMLSQRANDALKAGEYGEALKQVRTSRAFLEAHILSWLDPFEELALRLLCTRFYRGVLKASRGFFEFDLEMCDDLAEELENA